MRKRDIRRKMSKNIAFPLTPFLPTFFPSYKIGSIVAHKWKTRSSKVKKWPDVLKSMLVKVGRLWVMGTKFLRIELGNYKYRNGDNENEPGILD